MRMGFIGLGQMGTGMATSLIRAGHELTVYNRTREKAQPLAALGAKWPSGSPRPAGARWSSPCWRTIGPSRACSRERGHRRHLAGAIHVSCSTISVGWRRS